MANCGHCGKPPKVNKFLFFLYKFLFWVWSFFKKWNATPPGQKRIAFVSVYNAPCGISTYNEELMSELRNKCDIKVFAEYKTYNKVEEEDDVVYCWSRKEHPKKNLINELIKYNPDIVHFGHEYGFFDKSFLFTQLVSFLKSKKIKVVATMHSVYEHLDKTVQESAPDCLIVHTKEAKDLLIDKGLNGKNIFVVPHGNSASKLLLSLWNTWGTNTIYQPGFLFDYKGHLNMLDVVYNIKLKGYDVHYIIQGSENPNTMKEHNELYEKIYKKADKLGILENVTVHRGFVDEKILLNTIRTSTCVVLPYLMHPEHDVRASSGIARKVLSTTTPLITSDVHLFDDIKDCVMYSSSLEEIENNIIKVFDKDYPYIINNNKRLSFITNNSWAKIADKIVNIYKEM